MGGGGANETIPCVEILLAIAAGAKFLQVALVTLSEPRTQGQKGQSDRCGLQEIIGPDSDRLDAYQRVTSRHHRANWLEIFFLFFSDYRKKYIALSYFS